MELKDLLLNKIKALYDIESVIIESLPELVNAATDKDLKKAFKDHLDESKDQKDRLEKIFGILEEDLERLEAEAIRGLAKDTKWVVENIDEGNLLDINLIAAASYVEHYEMAGYNAAIRWAEKLEMKEVADLLNLSFTEEETADGKLQDIAGSILERVS
jgi:ferritin-like metal-binding protein YciE